MELRTLLVDNYDSYTFNLFQLIAAVNGLEPVVVTNDDPVLTRLSAGDFDNVVLSPGPGRPQCPRDIGFVTDLLQAAEWPVLGVCLGHQAIGYLAGGEVGLAPEPRHGYLSQIRHHGDDLFAGIPAVFTGARYHSLCVAEPLPETLMATAWAEDGVIMALRHRDLPRWGGQFHPESIATQYGQEILANFAELTDRTRRRTVGRPAGPRRSKAQPSAGPGRQPDRGIADPGAGRAPDGSAGLRLITQVVHTPVDTEQVFTALFGTTPNNNCLDCSLAQAGLARISYLGDGSGPLSETLTYRVGDVGVEIHDAGGVRMAEGNAFDVLDRRLGKRRLRADAELPFDFTAGYVGYFGYEMKADCGAGAVHRAPTPDALWIFADRLIAVDHEAGLSYLLAVHDGSNRMLTAARGWLDQTARRLAALAEAGRRPAEPDAGRPAPHGLDSAGLAAWLVRDQPEYEADVTECRRQLTLGESYEICLTNRLHLPFDDDALALYLRLRRANPAPYAALLRGAGVTVFSSSPERFLHIARARRAESKPIKGTAPRHPDPAQDARIAQELAP